MLRHLSFLVALSACTTQAPLQNIAFFGGTAEGGTPAHQTASNGGTLEVFVKTNHPTLVSQIAAGGGTELMAAMDLALIPESDRAARLIQLQSDLALYRAAPGALVTALRLYGR
ncbi:hypothetical protein [Yoonia litorea]|uniref:Uncharacterized protein n=1 Tax=Yoonia litorea TaxID=1123755 RepID=A0A1I6M6C6_9RHOB|nr:hypothetical protein [Yoonia litorea]SFS11173.1 hypothetical protein SAMN05444714_1287 [Yoonia litorea]